jgi:hypothetical protein
MAEPMVIHAVIHECKARQAHAIAAITHSARRLPTADMLIEVPMVHARMRMDPARREAGWSTEVDDSV